MMPATPRSSSIPQAAATSPNARCRVRSGMICRSRASSSASISAAVPTYRSATIFGRPPTRAISRKYQYVLPLIFFGYRLAINLGHTPEQPRGQAPNQRATSRNASASASHWASDNHDHRKLRLAYGIAVVELPGPEEADQGDGGAPGDGDDCAVADRGAQQQPSQRLDDGGERLVLREPAQPGRHRVSGDEPAAEERQEHQRHGQVAGGLDGLGHHAQRDAQPGDRKGDHRQDTGRRDPLDGTRGGPEPDEQGDPDDDRQAEHRLDQAAEHVSGQHRWTEDGHGAEPGDDALGHVHGHRDGRPLGRGGHGHQQDPGSDVLEVGGAAAGGAAEPGAQRAAKDVDEQQQEDDRHADQLQRHGRVPQRVPEVAPQHRRRIAHGIGEGAHRAGSFSLSGWPVRARKTSSRSGAWIDNPSTSIDSSSSRSSKARSDRTPPSLGTCKVSASSSRNTCPRVRAADSSPSASANCRLMWPPGMRRLSSSAVPSATSFPWSRSAIRSASSSASSRYCVVRKMVTPPATRSRMICHMVRWSACPGRRCVGRRPGPSRSRWCRSAIRRRFSSPVSRLSTAENWPVTPIAARTASGSGARSWPSTRISPPSGLISVDRICTVVVLPAPLGPSSAKTVPAGTVRSIPSSTSLSPNDLRRPTAAIADWDDVVFMLLVSSLWPWWPRPRRGCASRALPRFHGVSGTESMPSAFVAGLFGVEGE